MKTQKIVIKAGNDGDRSVGIEGTNITITIESNLDLSDVRILDDELEQDYQAGIESGCVLFSQELEKLLEWIADERVYVSEIKLV